jgi:succinoglycan biosynthesis transport protein ExoP
MAANDLRFSMLEESDELQTGNLGDYWSIVVRRRWWILLPTFVCWAMVWTGGWLWPDRYESEALILVEQQKVPEHYVVPNVTLDVQDRVRAITQRILSRTRLQATIDRFHLYQRSHGLSGLLQTNDPVEQMRKDIQIELVQSDGKTAAHTGDLAAFKIRYFAASTEMAQQVNSELTSLFIDENLKSQQELSESTTAFLNSQLADARAKLEEQEAKVREFKAKHLGDLPSQLESNVQILSGLQSQLQTNEHALDSATQQRLYLESLLQQYRSARSETGTGDPTARPEDALDKELMDARSRLAEARSKYTEDHPDIVALKDKIAKAEALKKQMEKEMASKQKATADGSASGEESASPSGSTSNSMMQVQSQLKANQLEIQNYEKRRKDLEAQISSYRARLNLTPATEQELAEISRGYEESNTNYNSLLQKQNQSQLATSLEQRQQGERFSIIDPPSAPLKPSSPNHLLVSLGGLAFGIAGGFVLIAFLELTDVRVRREKDLADLVRARVLVGIPHLSTRTEDYLRGFRRWAEIATAVAMVVLIAVGNFYAFYKG